MFAGHCEFSRSITLLIVVFLLLTPVLGIHWQPTHLFFLFYLGYPATILWPSLARVSSKVAITHLWSLSVEEQFYLAWPWVIARLRNPATILRACALVAISALVLRTAICATGRLNVAWAYTFLLCRMDTIATGAAIAILVRGSWRERIEKSAPLVFILGVATVILVCVFRRTVDHDDPVIATIGFSFLAIMYGSLLVMCVSGVQWVGRLFSFSVLRTFGKYSYGLYLFHLRMTAVLGPLKAYFVSLTHSYLIGSCIHLAFNLAVNLSIAVASFQLFESPIMRLKRRFRYA
jgi:peptidoglycan/LPS O-acetylase OafA/YrhL